MLFQIVHEIELSGVAGIPGTAAQKQKLQFPVYVFRMIEETGQVLLQVELGVADQSRAELSHPREQVQVFQPDGESLAAAHGKAGDGAVLAAARDAVHPVNHGNDVGEQLLAEQFDSL